MSEEAIEMTVERAMYDQTSAAIWEYYHSMGATEVAEEALAVAGLAVEAHCGWPLPTHQSAEMTTLTWEWT